MTPETTNSSSRDEGRVEPWTGDPSEEPADPHSRLIVDYLQRTDGPVEVARLATEVAAILTGRPAEDVEDSLRRRVQTWFHHGQLPALDEAGVIEYDPDRGTVRLPADR